ncbi:hypothetical protein NP233_g7257 [Leucocoprinus birnbaumii]|uniref:DUF221-domain-containing protein n=1 Tax=Leucocoprinus birnbaumii TaxID=56174 RepID=A0AAD5VQH0_9AGAR|nr:hypothetical protein NP233_g7257 [Leucocoprinus birnbaumii]
MGDIQTRPFSKNYSGLINQSVIAAGITIVCVGSHEFMKRRRRGSFNPRDELGSRESWEFGYLYQGRSWARFPSPPSPKGWILSWVRQALAFPEAKLHELRGVDATLYIRFLRGCFYFALLQALTTFPILFPIHVRFSDASISPKSMTRASISSMVGTQTGLSLLWIHICLLFWITLSWMATLLWICNGAFKLRAVSIDATAKQLNSDYEADTTYYPHPHPQFGFTEVPIADRNHPNRGLRCRTIMVSYLPHTLRNEKDLKEYFEYYMTRKVEKPSMGLTSSVQPGFFNKSLAFLFNRAKKLPAQITPRIPVAGGNRAQSMDSHDDSKEEDVSKPIIERVVIARKMTELASLLERREEVMRRLETAHIKLASKTLLAVKGAMDRQSAKKPLAHSASKAMGIARQQRKSLVIDVENGIQEEVLDEEARMAQLIKVLGPFVEEFGLQYSLATRSKKVIASTSQHAFKKLRSRGSDSENSDGVTDPKYPPPRRRKRSQSRTTVWDALLSLPRSSLDAYQPLVHLERVFSGQLVPSIDYWTARLNYLTTMITEQRAKAPTDLEPLSTAFVTFADPADARRACKYLAVHPNNPLACLVTMAPMYNDLDWIRVMRSSPRVELIKDWVVDIGVWGFTLFWLFPVSLLVGLVSIQNISLFWPSLKRYLDHHPWQSEVIQSFLPTLLVALLALLIPLILLLIAKKAHTFTTLSALHDRIMTRYYKFLIVNVLVFFCVGTAALQSVLQWAFKSSTQPNVLEIVADSFPTAGPFYVGWLIFTTAMHGGFELALLGLPLIMYPTTRRQLTPRKRAVGIRPRTFNFYYWLPNHLLIIHVLLLFSVLNPVVLPFGALYFFIQSGVVKNQFIHVYAKHYEGNGQHLLIRIVRYSLDGLVLTQGVFLAYMVVLKKSVNVGLAAFLIVFTVVVKIILTRMCRAHFETQDLLEADILCNKQIPNELNDSVRNSLEDEEARAVADQEGNGLIRHTRRQSTLASAFKTWKLPAWVNFTYNSVHHRTHQPQRRPPIPFGRTEQSFSRLHSMSVDQQTVSQAIRDPVSQTPIPQSGNRAAEDVKHSPEPRPRPHPIQFSEAKPVVPHPPPIPWDDQEVPDLPYDNPFYARTVDNSLWLPRNPCGLLNLDDTVDLRVSLTVELAAGELGTFPFGLLQRTSPGEMSQISSSPMTTQSLNAASPVSFTRELPDVDGTEEIDLPPAIVRRVQAGEPDAERIPRPRTSSGYRGKLSGAAKSTLSLGSPLGPAPKPGRPSILGPSHSSSLGSTSDGREHGGRGRSHSIMSALQLPPTTQPAQSSDHELGIRHEGRIHVDPVATSASTSRVSLAPPLELQSSRSQNLSASKAILREVVAEEQDAKESRIREEQNEATSRSRLNKSWWTSWMFKNLH